MYIPKNNFLNQIIILSTLRGKSHVYQIFIDQFKTFFLFSSEYRVINVLSYIIKHVYRFYQYSYGLSVDN